VPVWQALQLQTSRVLLWALVLRVRVWLALQLRALQVLLWVLAWLEQQLQALRVLVSRGQHRA
jgi:hypothetical protein